MKTLKPGHDHDDKDPYMPPDPTPLTEAEIREVEHAREYATAPYSQISNTDSRHEETRDRCIVWRLDDAGNDFATFTGENAPTNAVFYILAHKHLPALLAAAREKAKAQAVARDYGEAFMLVWGMVMPENSAYTGCTQSAAEVLRHEVDLMRQANKELARENAGLRKERDDRIRANVRLCEEIKSHRAERDMAQLELSKANARYEQKYLLAEAILKERDAALARVAELAAGRDDFRSQLVDANVLLGRIIVPPPPDKAAESARAGGGT